MAGVCEHRPGARPVITTTALDQWRHKVPWLPTDQIEQDLVLSRVIVEIANHPLLGDELEFRGGTCLHKVFLDRPLRYSEDLDYVRRSSGGVGEVLDALREVGDNVGFDRIRTQVSRHPKVRFDSTFLDGGPLRLKVEMNTFERSPARPLQRISFDVDSPWFAGTAELLTFAMEELVATKVRALYQRSKGRDLFDLWLAVKHAGLAPVAIAACFAPYRPDGWSKALAINNLTAKVNDRRFIDDLSLLIPSWPPDYTLEAGAEVAQAVIAAIDD